MNSGLSEERLFSLLEYNLGKKITGWKQANKFCITETFWGQECVSLIFVLTNPNTVTDYYTIIKCIMFIILLSKTVTNSLND